MPHGTCAVEGCERPVERRIWCNAHYKRWKRHGDPLAGRVQVQQGDPVERFWGKVNKAGPLSDHRTDLGPCWLWTGYLTPRGYGTYTLGSGEDARWASTHRVAYELTVGPIPEGLELDHLCRTPACCNPLHLEPVTGDENMRRTRKTYCIRGHRQEGDTVYVSPKGARQCRECMKIRDAARPPRRKKRSA